MFVLRFAAIECMRQQTPAMNHRYNQKEIGLNPVDQAIAIYRKFAQRRFFEFRDLTPFPRKWLKAPRRGKHFANDLPGIIFRIPGDKFGDQLEIFTSLRRPMNYLVHCLKYSSASS